MFNMDKNLCKRIIKNKKFQQFFQSEIIIKPKNKKWAAVLVVIVLLQIHSE